MVGLAILGACSSSHSPGVGASSPDASTGGGGADSGGVIADAAGASDAAIDPIQQDYDDLAMTLVDAIRSTQLQALQDGINTAYGGGQLPGFTEIQPGELVGTRGDVRYDYMFHCEDQLAHDNYTCGPASNHIHWMATISGPAAIDQLTFAEYKLSSHWTIRNIYLNKPTVEDTDTLRLDATLATDGTRFQLTANGTFDHVLLDPQPTEPFGGGISYAVTVTRTRAGQQRSYTATAVITFTGPGVGTVVLDGTNTYNIDMNTGSVSRM